MEIGNIYLPLGRDVVTQHHYKMPKVAFAALDWIHIPARGGDWNKRLLQIEQKWIYKLGATKYLGLNESISYVLFLKGYSWGKNS